MLKEKNKYLAEVKSRAKQVTSAKVGFPQQI